MSSDVLPRQPHSLEAEKTVLGALLLDPEAIFKVRPLLSADDFYDPVYKSVYEACVSLSDQQIPLDFTLVANALQEHDRIQAIGGSAFLADLAASVPTSSHAIQYAQIIREKSQRRQLLKASQKIAALACEEDESFVSCLGSAQESLLRLNGPNMAQATKSLAELTEAEYQIMEEILNGGAGDEPKRFYTGFSGLDYLFEGLRAQDLTVIVGRPGMGKTALMLTMAMNGAQMFGKRVLFMSREMSNRQNARRIISSRLGVSMTDMDRGEISEDEVKHYGQLIDQFRKLSFTFDDDPDASISSLRSQALRHQMETGLDVLFVDYLQLLEPPTDTKLRYSNRVEQMSKISRDMKQLARELDVPLIVGCQMNRAVETRPDKRPQLSDIRESGSIEQDADNVIMMHRDSYYDLDGDSEDVTQLYIRKHRQGAMGVVEVQFKQDTTEFLQVDREHENSEIAA
ncbi:MAG: replicative DNA helicase [Pseudomonadota bacterium]